MSGNLIQVHPYSIHHYPMFNKRKNIGIEYFDRWYRNQKQYILLQKKSPSQISAKATSANLKGTLGPLIRDRVQYHNIWNLFCENCYSWLKSNCFKLRVKESVTYRLALLVLASVQHSPVDLSRVPLGQEGRLTLGIQKLEHLMKSTNLSDSLWFVGCIKTHPGT